jgi:uncharacterized protein YggE
MKNIITVIVTFFLMLFVYTKLAGPIPFSLQSIVTTKSDVFTVTGTGKAVAIPDVAVVTVGVSAQGATVKAVQQEINKSNTNIIDAIKKLGIDAKDIQTSNYSLSPMYDYRSSPTRITGYQARTTVTIHIRDTDRANEVIDSATANGANQIGGLTFEVSDKTKVENEAREKAIEEAKLKAETAARAAGFTLGAIINYSEGFGTATRLAYDKALPVAGGAEAMGEPTQIETGSSEITITVNLSYEIR